MKVRMRAAGAPDFEVDIEPTSTVMDIKIAATAGCDIDPQVMRLIFKGKVLKDEDVVSACGVRNGEALHIARGQPAKPAAAVAAPSAVSPGAYPGGEAAAGLLTLTLKYPGTLSIKGPAGVDEDLTGLRAEEPVERIRALAATKCGLRPEEVHLVHKAKMLRDGSTLAESNINSGDVLRIARRQVASTATTCAPQDAPAEMVGSGPMPMAWGRGLHAGLPPGVEDQARMAAQAMGVPLEEILGGLPLQQVVAAAAAPPRRPGQPEPGETAFQLQARFVREADDMARQVRAYLAAERARAAAGEGTPIDAPAVGADEDFELDDPEFLGTISGILAEARSRGAPVPNAAYFVDRAVNRRRQARAMQVRLDREAQGMDADLEEAFLAAERIAAAAEREDRPRRLGHGPAPTGDAQSPPDGGASRQ